MITFNSNSNLDAIVLRLAKLKGVSINAKDVNTELEKHPDYPSLLALSDVLSWFKIKNEAYKITTDQLPEIPVPYVIYTKKNKDFAIVEQMSSDHAVISNQNYNAKVIKRNTLDNMFEGVVLALSQSEKKDAGMHLRQQQGGDLYRKIIAGLALSFVSFFVIYFYSGYFDHLDGRILLLTVLKSAGVLTSILLLLQSIDQNNPLLQTLCGGSKKTDCNAILSSKSARVFKGLTWSEVGFFYFSGSLLTLLFCGGSTAELQALSVLNILSLPYTIYSINFQARVAKQWCVLCCTVQCLLWLEFLPLSQFLYRQPTILLNFKQTCGLITAFAIPIGIWLILKPFFLNNQELSTMKKQFRKFKFNKFLFDILLRDQAKYATPDKEWTIVLGNENASSIITMISNPYCPPCSKSHQELDLWLNGMEDIQVRLVFLASDNKGQRNVAAKHFMALNELTDKSIIKSALNDWYNQENKNYESWAKNYPVKLDNSQYDKLEKQNKWCEIAGIDATPTLLINGYKLPAPYQLPDIKYMVRE